METTSFVSRIIVQLDMFDSELTEICLSVTMYIQTDGVPLPKSSIMVTVVLGNGLLLLLKCSLDQRDYSTVPWLHVR